MFCGKCNSQIVDGSKFCPVCGASQQAFQQVYRPTEGGVQNTGTVPFIPYAPQGYGVQDTVSPQPYAESGYGQGLGYPQANGASPYPQGQTDGEKGTCRPGVYPQAVLRNQSVPVPGQEAPGLLAAIKSGIQEIIRHPAKLLPTIILAVVWIALSLLSGLGKDVPGLRWLTMLTYSNGGMYGGILGGMGGIFGKAVFAAVVNTIVLSLWKGENPFAPSQNRNGGLVRQATASGLDNVAPFICGAGTGLVLYCFFNVTSSTANWMVGLVAAVGAVQAAVSSSGLLFLIIVEVVRKLSGNRVPASLTITRSLAGLSAGFAVGIPLTFMRQPIIILGAGIILLLLGILLTVLGKNRTQGMVGMVLFPVLLSASAGWAFSPFGAEAAGSAPTVKQICEMYTSDCEKTCLRFKPDMPERNLTLIAKAHKGE